MIRNKKAYAVEIAKQSIQQLSKKSKPRRTAYDLIVQIAAGLLDQAAQESDVRERWNMIRFGAYDVVRQNMEEPLGQLMRQISPDVAGQDSEAPRRINRDVKFSGKTKIVKIEVGDQVIYPRGQRNEIQ
jgi:hypothetical protein